MNLLIDIGNSRIKWGIDKNGVIKTGQPIDYKQADFRNEVHRHCLKLEAPQLLAISTVSAKEIAIQIIEIAKSLWPDINVLMAKSLATSCFVKNAYHQADKLGVDRWLGLIALQHYYPGNSCMVDCGTAITIDCLDASGQHLGGLISPGLQLMKHSLYQGTESLSFVHQNYSVGLSSCTESAIYSGILYAAVGLIEKAINDLCNCQTLVLTGGNAELLAQYLAIDSIIDPDLVLKGLSLFSKEEI